MRPYAPGTAGRPTARSRPVRPAGRTPGARPRTARATRATASVIVHRPADQVEAPSGGARSVEEPGFPPSSGPPCATTSHSVDRRGDRVDHRRPGMAEPPRVRVAGRGHLHRGHDERVLVGVVDRQVAAQRRRGARPPTGRRDRARRRRRPRGARRAGGRARRRAALAGGRRAAVPTSVAVTSSPPRDEPAELGVAPHVVVGVVGMGREHEQHGVGGVVELARPDERRDHHAPARVVEPQLGPRLAVVDVHRHRAVDAREELPAPPVGVLAAHVTRRHAVDHEVPLRRERQQLGQLARRELAAQVGVARDLDDLHAARQGRRAPAGPGHRRRAQRGRPARRPRSR
ncbi:MAG: hypothetical protein KatS3mg009_2574 [Acidimicrobiia bacterium]|nr:MAG: hypothetical protein KatS3mg009_2574 [Acidimicrobiia bacterium]